MCRCGLEIDENGNIVREGCGSCVVKVWVETNPSTGAGYYKEPMRPKDPKPKKKKKKA
jgi:hypothetical protein